MTRLVIGRDRVTAGACRRFATGRTYPARRWSARRGPAGSTSSSPRSAGRCCSPCTGCAGRAASTSRTGGYVLAANHWSNFDPWPLGIPLFPRRFLRFMAKKELFWPPLGWIVRGGRRLPGRSRQARPAGDRHRRGALPRRPRRRHVPRGDTAREGAAQAARGPLAQRRRADRARRPGVPLVPAGIAGTDRLEALRAAAGRLRRADRASATSRGLDEADAAAASRPTGCARRSPRSSSPSARRRRSPRRRMSAPLLVVDGDSFAHRAFHALPSSIKRANGRPGNLLTGLTSMLLRLWQAERPRAVFVGWDTLTVADVPARAARRATRPGASSTPRCSSSSTSRPGCWRRRASRAARRRGSRPTTSSQRPSPRSAQRGHALVATSDRDAFQLVADDVTILQPVRGVSEIARIGPAEVRERYGVEPEQVPDFIALRGDPSDKIPGARGIGAKTAATLLGQYRNPRRAARGRPVLGRGGRAAPLPPRRDARPDRARPAAPRPRAGLAGRRRCGGGARARPARGPPRGGRHRADLAPRAGAAPPDEPVRPPGARAADRRPSRGVR